ncbi:MAG: hypothetical protein A3J37_07315 [Alphaproteobacteria bacterium RIFCSPHIGHO2_12_FULL_45_9]|nr:MAG: hypothetical protein A3B66_04720 [Alphaproteobacteria bacterium RIFCSPHIGHO2_02_FULL_46_13]OFW96868.1 MAG: hypothetical protein A3J37_07315 [Alphaproteobacteria bacterium RIFCSPHIGHO2_12_FULL_45_9]
MLRMSVPSVSWDQSVKECKDGIERNTVLLKKLEDGAGELADIAENYRSLGIAGNLFTVPQASIGDPIIAANLRKSEFINLYEYYLRGKHPGRAVYDSLLNSANGQCPFCGGIGRPRNLDHFMPKAHFPQFSILPLNLIPCCWECNMDGKGENFARVAKDQFIHPFLDNTRFFNEQWIFATYNLGLAGEPNSMSYYTKFPSYWTQTDKDRAKNHFETFDLAKRYKVFAGPALVEIEAQMNSCLKKMDMHSFKEAVLQSAIDAAPFANYWKRVMCISLIETL